MKQTKRILVCEFYQETNTFNLEPFDLKSFEAIRLAEGEDLYQRGTQAKEGFHGMVDAIEETGAIVVPGISLYAGAGGRILDEAFQYLLDRTEYYIKNSDDFDAVFVSCHGAACTMSQDDATGVFLEFIRNMIGQEKLIAISCDLHANITDRILNNVDIICGYNSYPHTDLYETGHRTASLGIKKLNGEQIYMAAVHIPMLVPPSGYNTICGSFKDVKEYGEELVQENTLLDYSTFIVQPWLDISEIASTIITIATEAEIAKRYADYLASRVFAIRDEMWPSLYTIDKVIDIAERSDTPKPVILVDSADSPNAGAVGDSVEVASRLIERKSKLHMGFFVKDNDAVNRAFEIGVGNSGKFTIGAKYTVGMKKTITATGIVHSLHEGSFRVEGSEGRNMLYNIGPAAVLNFGSIDVLVCKAPTATGDPQLFRHFGIEPKLYDLIVVKANTSFRAPYGAIADKFYYADTSGASAANLRKFEWKHIPANLYPFDLEENYSIDKAKICRG